MPFARTKVFFFYKERNEHCVVILDFRMECLLSLVFVAGWQEIEDFLTAKAFQELQKY
jgi:hypothetical protein